LKRDAARARGQRLNGAGTANSAGTASGASSTSNNATS